MGSMFGSKKKEKENLIVPAVQRTLYSGARGYCFGLFVGLFTSPFRCYKNTVKDVHSTGVTFFKMGIIHNGTKEFLEIVREKKDDLNDTIAGLVAGGMICSKRGAKRAILGGLGLSSYSIINKYYEE